MKNNPTTIIAFFARGREIGFVILDDGELIRYGVKTIKGKRQGRAFTRSVENVLLPLLKLVVSDGLIVMERITDFSRKGALCRILHSLSNRWKNQKYQVRLLTLETVKKSVCEDRKATHRELIEAIVRRYLLLWPVIMNPTSQKAKYWEKVGIAMALAEAAKNIKIR